MLLIYAVEALAWLTEKIGKMFLARRRAKNIRILYYRAVSAAEIAAVERRTLLKSYQRDYISFMN